MAAKVKLILLSMTLTVVWLSLKLAHFSHSHKQLPHHIKEKLLDVNTWWGPNQLIGSQDTSVRPFKIKFDEDMVKDLKSRLKNHRPLTPALEGVAFEYGFNSGRLDTWIKYWADEYPFAAREKFLNQYPQFKTNIQGLDIHFIRIKPEVSKDVEVVPLLLLHGWPGSVREFYEAAPQLATKTPSGDFTFELIIPSLPGYGFSDAAVRPGMDPSQMAVVMRNLMQRLGIKKYYVQGGDAGGMVAALMTTIFPDEILGFHSNLAMVYTPSTVFKIILGSFFPSLVVEPHLADRLYPLSSFFAHLMEEFGYFHIQATKPDTVGTSLSDSPAGLLAYILEKFSTWTVRNNCHKPDGGLEAGSRYSQNQLIDNIMLYWTSNSITTSMRLYAETNTKKFLALNQVMDLTRTTVPTWVMQAKEELFYQTPAMLRTKYERLVNVTVLEDGGHFIAMELPKVFAEDVFKAVEAFRKLPKIHRYDKYEEF